MSVFLTVHDIVGYQVSDWYHNTMNNNWVILTLCKILSPPHQKTKMSLEVTPLRIRLVQESDFLISFCNFRYSLRNCRNFACESILVVWRRSRERVTKRHDGIGKESSLAHESRQIHLLRRLVSVIHNSSLISYLSGKGCQQ